MLNEFVTKHGQEPTILCLTDEDTACIRTFERTEVGECVKSRTMPGVFGIPMVFGAERTEFGFMNDLEKIVHVLNSMYVDDPAAMHALVANRVPCNQALADHTVVPVEQIPIPNDDAPQYSVGLLGILNGVVETLTGQRVAAKWLTSTDGRVPQFLGFTVAKPPCAPVILGAEVRKLGLDKGNYEK